MFSIETPVGEPSLSAASITGIEHHPVSASDLTGTRRAEPVPRPFPPPREVEEDDEPLVQEKPFLRPSVPQDFPGALVVEAWLPLGLGVIAAVWVISQTFSSNETGRGWVPMLRLGVVALLYLGLVIPLTYKVVQSSFRTMRRLLPPSSGPHGMALRRCRLHSVMRCGKPAAARRLLLRIDPGRGVDGGCVLADVPAEPAGSGQFVYESRRCVSCRVRLRAAIVVGGNAILNRSMVTEHGGSIFKESPLGQPLAWNWQEPPPAPVAKPQKQYAKPQSPIRLCPSRSRLRPRLKRMRWSRSPSLRRLRWRWCRRRRNKRWLPRRW